MLKTEVYKMSFLVVRCFSCGKVQVQEKRRQITDMTFACKYCRKTRVYHSKRTGLLNIVIYDNFINPKDATISCQKYQRLRSLNKFT